MSKFYLLQLEFKLKFLFFCELRNIQSKNFLLIN